MKQDLRTRRGMAALDGLMRDVRHASRQLRTAKWFTASAALTLALGVASSTAVFAVLDTVVLRPLPYAEPDRLMAFRSMDRRGPRPTNLSYPNFFDFRAQNRVFEHFVSYRDERFTLSDSLPAIQVQGEIVSWDLFPLLGVQPELGRGFLPEEEQAGAHVVILSHSLWRNRFGGDPRILNRRLRINSVLYTVAGVTPAGFRFPVDNPAVQLWTTLSADASHSEFTPLSEQRGARVIDVIGRLKPGITPDQARAQMDVIAAALARSYPDNNKNVATVIVTPELERLTGTSRTALWILLGAVGLVLLTACANVAGILLARSTDRSHEFTLRAALGASHSALTRQLLVESLVLAMIGAAAGVVLTIVILKLIVPMAGESIPRISLTVVDERVLCFALLVSMATGVLFSLAPLTQVLRANVAGTLKEGAPSIARGHDRFRSTLVVGQITLGLVLLAGAQVLMGSFLDLMRRDAGFRADHLLMFDVGLSETEYRAGAQTEFCDRLLERLRAIPGVQAVSTGMPLPLQGSQMSVSFDIEDRPAPPPDRPRSNMAIVSPGYFRAMAIPIIRGRDFSERDDANASRVVVVNQAFARRHFPGQEVIGKRILPGATNGKEGTRMREIVGVVGDAKQEPLSVQADPIYYFPYKQLSWAFGTVVVRTIVPPREVESAARAALASLDPRVPMYMVRTGEDLASTAIAGPRFQTVLMTIFAGIALILTLSGLYGVLSYAVARRHREIGVRIALGAHRGQIVRLVLGAALQLLAAGLILGSVGALSGVRLLDRIVYHAHAGNPVIIATACCTMIITGLAAAYLPAARAASVNPVQALRGE